MYVEVHELPAMFHCSSTAQRSETLNPFDSTSINSAVQLLQNESFAAQCTDISKIEKKLSYTVGVLVEVKHSVVKNATRTTQKHHKWTAANYLWLIKSFEERGEYKSAAKVLGTHFNLLFIV